MYGPLILPLRSGTLSNGRIPQTLPVAHTRIATQNRAGSTRSSPIIRISASVESVGRSSVGSLSRMSVGSFNDLRRQWGMVAGTNRDLEGLEIASVHVCRLSQLLRVSPEEQLPVGMVYCYHRHKQRYSYWAFMDTQEIRKPETNVNMSWNSES